MEDSTESNEMSQKDLGDASMKTTDDLISNICANCLGKSRSATFLHPKQDTLDIIRALCSERLRYGDLSVATFCEFCKGYSSSELVEAGFTLCRECYADLRNVKKRDRAMQRYNKSMASGDASFTQHNLGRPKISKRKHFDMDNSDIDIVPNLRSSTLPYDANKCVICQNAGGTLHLVQSQAIGYKLYESALKFNDTVLANRLNTVGDPKDVRAIGCKYHRQCLVEIQRKVCKENSNQLKQQQKTARTLADIEILNYIETYLAQNRTPILNMTILNELYGKLLINNGFDNNNLQANYKVHLKSLIIDNLPTARLIQSYRLNEPTKIVSSRMELDALTSQDDNSTNTIKAMMLVTKVLRDELKRQQEWKFDSTFDDFVAPQMLTSFIKWLLFGPCSDQFDINEHRSEEVKKDVSTVTNMILQTFKTNRQVRYVPKEGITSRFNSLRETPFSVGLGLLLHHKTRCKLLIDQLAQMKISIPYDKVISIESKIAEEMKSSAVGNPPVCMPSNISNSSRVCFAIDNIDFKNDSCDGKSQYHGTCQIVIQPNAKEDNHIIMNKTCDFRNSLLDNTAWFVMRTLYKDNIPTWSAYNSLLHDASNTSTVSIMPLIRGPPTDLSNMLSALKLAQNISVTISPGEKTIVSLDMPLYIKCVQLQFNSTIGNDYIFRIEDLHVVFACLRAIGKYIDGSGLDQCFVEADIYGPATMENIKNGKHMKRALNAYTTLYLSLNKLYMEKLQEKNPQILNCLQSKLPTSESMCLKFSSKKATGILRGIHKTCVDSSIESDYPQLQNEMNETFSGQSKFFRNVMDMLEILMLFIKSTRQRMWSLNLSSLELFTKYFFANDQTSYARMVPFYIHEMEKLKSEDPSSWKYLEDGHFTVNKSEVPFTAIGVDHAIEHAIRSLKVTGGVKGITSNESALERFCLTAPELSRISEGFSRSYGVSPLKRESHHELVGKYNSHLAKNVETLSEIFQNFCLNFDENTYLYNILTKTIAPKAVANDITMHGEIGHKLAHTFIQSRIHGNKSIWEKLPKSKLKTFRSLSKSLKVNIGDSAVTIKEEKRLMNRFIVVSMKRPEINLPQVFGNFEFSVVPLSMFSADGCPLIAKDKSKIMHCIEDLTVQQAPEINDVLTSPRSDNSSRKTVILDGMVILHSVKKDRNVKTCLDLANLFTQKVQSQSVMYSRLYLLFDRYELESIKQQARIERYEHTSGIKYQIDDKTNVENVSLKRLLSTNQTKRQLTEYLAKHVIKHLRKYGNDFAVAHGTTVDTNIEHLKATIPNHSHEEADTLTILFGEYDSNTNNNGELHVFSPATDVFLLLIASYHKLCRTTIFHTGVSCQRTINISKVYHALAKNFVDAILGFHAFTGCDQTCKFNGKSKITCWKAFMDSSSEELCAFKTLGERDVMDP